MKEVSVAAFGTPDAVFDSSAWPGSISEALVEAAAVISLSNLHFPIGKADALADAAAPHVDSHAFTHAGVGCLLAGSFPEWHRKRAADRLCALADNTTVSTPDVPH